MQLQFVDDFQAPLNTVNMRMILVEKVKSTGSVLQITQLVDFDLNHST